MVWLILILLLLMQGCVTVIKPDIDLNQTWVNETQGLNETNMTNESTEEEVLIVGPCVAQDRQTLDECLFSEGLCANITNSSLRDKCYFLERSCENISSDSLRAKCMIERTLEVCDTLEAGDRAFCKANATLDYTYCGDNETCLLRYAAAFRNTEVCQFLEGAANTTCHALALRQFTLCLDEDSEVWKARCLEDYIRYAEGPYTLCDNIDSRLYREECFDVAARVNLDYRPCTEIDTYYVKRDCIMFVAVEKDDPNVCYFGDESYQDFCIANVAMRNYKPQYCEEVGVEYKWGCFGGSIVRGKVSEEDCLAISDKYIEWREKCLEYASQ